MWFKVVPAVVVGGSVAVAACAPGLNLGQSGTQGQTQEVTYNGQVAAVLNKNCVSCHRAGGAGPFSLEGYDNSKTWAKMVAVATTKKRMPPWKAGPADVQYADDRHLSDQDIATLTAWADAGVPRGKGTAPKPPVLKTGWQLGKPDAVWEMPYEQTLGEQGKDEYWNYVITPDITEPTWISALDVEPGNKRVVHHVIAFLDKQGRGRQIAKSEAGDGKSGYLSSGGGVGFAPDGALGGWAPGATVKHLPSDSGFLIEPGTDIILQIHYNKSGKVEKDRTKVGVYYQKGKPTKDVKIAWIANPFIRILPGEKDQVFKQQFRLPVAIDVYAVMPHMHYLGRAMTAWADLPDGKSIKVIDIQDWDFNWQLVYSLEKPLRLPAGTTLRVEAKYDNSSENPFQPFDPPRLVTWGEETKDEMMLLVALYTRA